MAKRTIFIGVNGIRVSPGDDANWTGKFVTFIQTKTPHKAEKVEYYCSTIGRAFGQKNRVDKLHRTLSFYRGWNIVLIGHSNGCAVINEMLNTYDDFPRIQYLHLFCGASEADFEISGYNRYLKEDRIGKINIYVAGKDRALFFAKTIMGRILGYKTLGIHGAYRIDESIEHRVNSFWTNPWNDYGHSSCFADGNFEDTMQYIIGNKPPTKKDIAETIEKQENNPNIVLNEEEIKEIRKNN